MPSTVGTRGAKDVLFDGFARVAAALASGRRLEIIDVLGQAPRSVEDISEAIGQSVANTSHHLRRLADDGLVRSQRDGRHIVYQLASGHVYELWRALQEVAAVHHHDLDARAEAYLGDRDELGVIDRETLRQRLDRHDRLVVIDVRPEAEYAAGHIDGAVSAPPGRRLGDVLARLPQGADIVAYCRGRYCAYADQAVRRLRASGRTAYRLEDGFREWVDSQTLPESGGSAPA